MTVAKKPMTAAQKKAWKAKMDAAKAAKAAGKKPAARKPAAKKPAAKKPAARKPAAKKPAARKPAAKTGVRVPSCPKGSFIVIRKGAGKATSIEVFSTRAAAEAVAAKTAEATVARVDSNWS